MQKISELEERIKKLEEAVFDSSGKLSLPKSNKKVSAKEFLLTKELKTETQKVLALAYYLESMEGLASFNVNDLENIFRSAKEKLPKNLNDAVNKNIARGMLMDAADKKEGKKAWYLTSTGENYVKNDLNK